MLHLTLLKYQWCIALHLSLPLGASTLFVRVNPDLFSRQNLLAL